MQVRTKARVLTALACFLFVISIFFPFLQVTWRGVSIPEFHPGPENLWSFKGTIEYWILDGGLVRREFWFSEYWFQRFQLWATQNEMLENWIGPFLILILISQILVTAFSISAVFMAKNKLFLYSAVVFNAFLLLCMLFVTFALDYDYDKYLSIGFWLSSGGSLALFAAALFLSRKDD